ncbi:class I adenylate-forming enzyme family protein [Massilia putida]|uniref:class I adenylate-forming enzyme family protein n=1 Tax=Massilia putida TaxID=1141883 RepID=UPI000A556F8C|nr:class I adenylate-forming enzyme family protein [Massilia putida]
MSLGLAERITTVLALEPGKGAIEFNGAWHSWEEIRDAMRQLDDLLTSAGLGEGTPIGIILRNRPAHFPALLEVLASGRCVVTINPFQPAEKLANDIRKLRLRAIVADAQDWALPELGQVVRELGSLAIRADSAPTLGMSLLAPGSGTADGFHEPMHGTCILMLTSGTTGPAKRIRLPFKHFERAIFDAEYYETKGGAMKLQIKDTPAVLATPLVHIGGMYAAVAAVASARPTVILEKFSVAEFRRVLAAYGPKLIALPPTAVRMILDAGVPREELACLRAIRTGSAPLDPALQESFESHYDVPLLDAYGATEFAGAVAGWTLKDHQLHSKTKRGSVGRAQPGCQLRVVALDTFEPVPCGTVGLLEVKTSQDAGAWMRTTDLAEIDADGFVFIRGRADDAIVRGGFKVLPREVEAIFRKHPAVKDACVVGLPDTRLGAVPVVAIELLEDSAAVTADELVNFARKDLVSYQVPVQAMIVQALPRTPSLKVSQHEVRNLFLSAQQPQVA